MFLCKIRRCEGVSGTRIKQCISISCGNRDNTCYHSIRSISILLSECIDPFLGSWAFVLLPDSILLLVLGWSKPPSVGDTQQSYYPIVHMRNMLQYSSDNPYLHEAYHIESTLAVPWYQHVVLLVSWIES